MNLTLKCKLNPNTTQCELLRKTSAAFSVAANMALEVAKKQKTKNSLKVQALCYRDIKQKTCLHAQFVCLAIKRATAALKTAEEFKSASIAYDVRAFSFRPKEETVSLATMNGRIHVPLVLGNYQRERLKNQNPKFATVNEKNGKWFIHMMIDVPDGYIPPPKGVIGVDRGIYNTVVTSTGKFYGGRHSMDLRKRFGSLRSRLQRKGTKAAKRRLKRLSGKEARRMAQVNHTISKRLVSLAKEKNMAIAMENLNGIRSKCGVKGKARKTHRKNMAGWAYYQLEQFVIYKAQLAGVATIFVTPYHTSQQCSKCGLIGNRHGAHFSCVCSYRASSDLNASRVIARRVENHLGLVRAALNQPDISLRVAA